MAKCKYCGSRFNLREARGYVNGLHIGDDEWPEVDYDWEFPDKDVCFDCARQEIATWMQAGADAFEY